ncbi:MAG: nucleoside hydrolase [Actinophytocola sp.]|nr:nucleoside hydrolase [Actinophytocola sp.]
MTSNDPLIVDCDTGIDDALALLYLLADPGIDLRAITTVFGNTSADTAAANTLRVLELAGRPDIPTAVGAASSLRGTARLAPHVHGDDGLGNTGLPTPAGAPVTEPAAELIVRLARENPGRLRLLAVGPLTNLATALRLDPELPELVSHVTIMGGAVNHPGNVTPWAEANVANDPEAARLVLRAGWDVTLVPLDVTMTELLTEEHRLRLLAATTPTSRFAANILAHYLDVYQRNVFGSPRAACHDPLAAAIAVGEVSPELAPIVPVDVDTSDGQERGRTVAGRPGRDGSGGPGVRVALRTEGTFPERLVQRLGGVPSRTIDIA